MTLVRASEKEKYKYIIFGIILKIEWERRKKLITRSTQQKMKKNLNCVYYNISKMQIYEEQYLE